MLDRLAREVETGWGACMLYMAAAPPPDARAEAHHLELIDDAAQPFLEGNHVFLSIGSEHDHGGPLRTMTASTHVPMAKLRAMGEPERAAYVQRVQDAMRATIERRAPEWRAGLVHELPASPRTFARFTGRHLGHVGGIPRRAGLANYLRPGPLEPAPGLLLVGDTAFPGQSTLATALGGLKVAESLDAAPGQVQASARR
jgi:phytoene dehydrogenase-like protein